MLNLFKFLKFIIILLASAGTRIDSGNSESMKEKAMKNIITVALIVLFIMGGCKELVYQPDLDPPTAPQGLSTETGNGFVELFWNSNVERDLAGYHIYVSSSYNGKYQLIGSATTIYFLDKGIPNGNTYYYAVTAYDDNGNESELSHDVVYDTPRPEGYDINLYDYQSYPEHAGYDFSTYSVGPYDDTYSDVFFEYYNGTYFLDVWGDSEIQDVGYTKSLYDVGYAPTTGWNPTKDARLVLGHTYVVKTWDKHYAKVRVISVSQSHIVFDWAYQLEQNNNRLKQGFNPGRQSLIFGSGIKSR